MLARRRLSELAEAKRLVVLQADLHRNLLRLETDTLRERLAGLTGTRDKLWSGRPVWVAGAVLAGVLAVSRWRALLRWAPAVVTAYRWFRRFAAK